MRPGAAVGVLAALVPAAILAVDPSGDSPFGPVKGLAVSTVAAAGVASVLWDLPGRRLRLARGPMAAWAVFLAVVVVAASFGVDGLYAWTGTPERRFGFVTWLLCAVVFVAGQAAATRFPGDRAGRAVAAATAVTVLLAGVWALGEALGWEPVALDVDGARLLGPLGSAAFLGAAACLCGPAAAGVALDRSWSRATRSVAGAATLLAVVALVGSGTRGAWLGALACLTVVLWSRRHSLAAHRRLALLGGAGAAGVVIAAGLALGVGGRVTQAFDSDGAGGRGRLDEWRVAVRVVARHPVLGVGPEGYRIAFAEGVDASYERRHGRSVVPDRAHNVLLDVAVTTGLPGLVAFAVLCAATGRLVLRSLRTGPPWRAGMAAGLVAYAAQALFLFPVSSLEPVAWLMAGVLVAGVTASDELIEVPAPRSLPAVGVLATVVFAVAGIRDVGADRHTRTALRQLRQGDLQAARRAAAAAVDRRPDVVRYRLAAARVAEAGDSAADDDVALAAVAQALRVSPGDPVALRERARLLLDRAHRTLAPADIRRARGNLDRLVGRDPWNGQFQLQLGVAAALDGDEQAAERAWLRAQDLAPTSAAAPANLASAYAAAGRWTEAIEAAREALRRQPGHAQAQAVLTQAEVHR